MVYYYYFLLKIQQPCQCDLPKKAIHQQLVNFMTSQSLIKNSKKVQSHQLIRSYLKMQFQILKTVVSLKKMG